MNAIRLALVLVFFTMTCGLAPASQQKSPLDSVPRNRLATDAEFLRLLDLNRSEFASVRTHLAGSDTMRALEAIAAAFRSRTSPRHFVSVESFRQQIGDFRSLYPEAVKKIISDARGFKRVYGSDVDWKVPGKDLLGRPHTPNTVRYLARQAQAENIALKYYFDGRQLSDLRFLVDQVKDFVSDYENGRAETGGNDVFERFYGGHRARNWLMIHQMLLSTPDYSWQDQILLIKVFLLHGARLIDVSEKFNWGNHQLVGLTGVYEVTVMYPEFPVMREWNAKALKTIMEHINKEIPPDGFQCERASHYFKLDIMNYFRIYRLSELNAIPLPAPFSDRFRAMFDALMAVAMPSKRVPVLQDGQARYEPNSNNAAELPEPTEEEFLSLGAALFGNPEHKFFGKQRFPASLVWFVSADQAKAYEALPSKQPSVLSYAFPQTQYYVMRTGWKPDDLYMVIDGGLAKDKPDHTHGGVLGVIAYAYGAEVLPSYPVRYSDPAYPIMKNSLVKNVALVDDLVQAREWIPNAARTGFGRWGKLPVPSNQEWISGTSADYFSATHDGFVDAGVQYRRSVIFLKPLGWLVLDDFIASGEHTYKQIWQGMFTIDAKKNAVIQTKGTSHLTISQLEGSDFTIREQSVASTTGVVFEKKQSGNFRFATLILPSASSDVREPKLSASRKNGTVEYSVSLGKAKWTFTESDGSKTISTISDKSQAQLILSSTHATSGSVEIRFSTPSTFEISRRPREGTTLTVLKSDSDSVMVRGDARNWISRSIATGHPLRLSQ